MTLSWLEEVWSLEKMIAHTMLTYKRQLHQGCSIRGTLALFVAVVAFAFAPMLIHAQNPDRSLDMLYSDPRLAFRVYNEASYSGDFLPLERSLIAGDYSMIDSLVVQMLQDADHSPTAESYPRYLEYYLPRTPSGVYLDSSVVNSLIDMRGAILRGNVDSGQIYEFLGIYLSWRCSAVFRKNWRRFPKLRMSDALRSLFYDQCGLDPIQMANTADGDLASPSDDEYLISHDGAVSLFRCISESYSNGAFEDISSLSESFDGTEASELKLWRSILSGASNGSLLVFVSFE